MVRKIWKPGDIITTEDYNYIENNSTILGAYRLPVTFTVSNDETIITISMSYSQIAQLLKQGVICYFISNNPPIIEYIMRFDDNESCLEGMHGLYFYPSDETPNTMVAYYYQEVN